MRIESLIISGRYRLKTAHARRALTGLLVAFLSLYPPLLGAVEASHHYTDKQMDALAGRVGQTFWLNSPDGTLPTFLNAPTATAAIFRSENKGSFVVTELTGQAKKDPYYAIKFDSGKVAYIRPDLFHEALNLSIFSTDPFAGENQKADERAAEEKHRVEWIMSQPWPVAIKEAAIKKQPTPGLTNAEVKRVFGAPQRITKLRGPIKASEEHWFYPDGSVLVMTNGLLSRMDKPPSK